jgi:hypothetical protein
MYKKLIVVAGLIGVGLAGRLAPHIPNTTPITAITITARKYVGRTWAYIIPIVAMAVSDVFIGFYDVRIMASVYVSFLLIAAMSSLTKKYASPVFIPLLAAMSSILFFLVTNFAVWLFSPLYAKSIWGLLLSYELGLPFLRNMLVGDVVFTTLLYGVFALAHMMLRRNAFSLAGEAVAAKL